MRIFEKEEAWVSYTAQGPVTYTWHNHVKTRRCNFGLNSLNVTILCFLQCIFPVRSLLKMCDVIFYDNCRHSKCKRKTQRDADDIMDKCLDSTMPLLPVLERDLGLWLKSNDSVARFFDVELWNIVVGRICSLRIQFTFWTGIIWNFVLLFIDWCFFYYPIKNNSVALLDALFARKIALIILKPSLYIALCFPSWTSQQPQNNAFSVLSWWCSISSQWQPLVSVFSFTSQNDQQKYHKKHLHGDDS